MRRPSSLFITYLAVAIGLSSCSSMLYYPSDRQFIDPGKNALKYDDLWIRSKDNAKIHAWWFHAENVKKPKALLVFFHGNGQNMSAHFASLAWILPYGYDYLIFDYRGYWKTAGKPSPENTVEDGISVLRYARDHASGTPLVIFGQSLGGAIALRAYVDAKTELPEVKLVVIDSSFVSYESVGRDVLSRNWLTWLFQPLANVLLSDKWAPGKRVREVSPTPLLIMHGDRDQVVSFREGQKLFELAAEPKEFWKIEDGYHTDAFWRHKGIYRQRFLEKLESMFGSKRGRPVLKARSAGE